MVNIPHLGCTDLTQTENLRYVNCIIPEVYNVFLT